MAFQPTRFASAQELFLAIEATEVPKLFNKYSLNAFAICQAKTPHPIPDEVLRTVWGFLGGRKDDRVLTGREKLKQEMREATDDMYQNFMFSGREHFLFVSYGEIKRDLDLYAAKPNGRWYFAADIGIADVGTDLLENLSSAKVSAAGGKVILSLGTDFKKDKTEWRDEGFHQRTRGPTSFGFRIYLGRNTSLLFDFEYEGGEHRPDATISKLKAARGSPDFLKMVELAVPILVLHCRALCVDFHLDSSDIRGGLPANCLREFGQAMTKQREATRRLLN